MRWHSDTILMEELLLGFKSVQYVYQDKISDGKILQIMPITCPMYQLSKFCKATIVRVIWMVEKFQHDLIPVQYCKRWQTDESMGKQMTF